jgi:hypothetical protein
MIFPTMAFVEQIASVHKHNFDQKREVVGCLWLCMLIVFIFPFMELSAIYEKESYQN